MIINKSQKQTFEKIAILLRQPVFNYTSQQAAFDHHGQYSNKKPNEMSKNALLFFKYGTAKLYLIFPIVRIFQIARKLVKIMTYL
jgi:hypothetical protein